MPNEGHPAHPEENGKSVQKQPTQEEIKIDHSNNPYDKSELRSVFTMPFRILEIVLAEPERLAKTIASGNNVTLLAGALLYTSVIFTLPFGAVIGMDRFWRIALLFVGSLAICFPSLQVFSAYVGCHINTRQNMALGLVITCVAGIFTFGFFPILWFLKATMEDAAVITAHHIALALLIFSLLAGIGHLYRCLYHFKGLVTVYPVLLFFWQVLFVFITYRMARILGLLDLPSDTP